MYYKKICYYDKIPLLQKENIFIVGVFFLITGDFLFLHSGT